MKKQELSEKELSKVSGGAQAGYAAGKKLFDGGTVEAPSLVALNPEIGSATQIQLR